MSGLREMGPYQRRLLLWLVVGGMGHGSWMMSTLFTMGVPQFRCAVPDLQNDTFEIRNNIHAYLVSASIPFDLQKNGSYSQCFRYEDHVNKSRRTNNGVNQSECANWVYDRSAFQSSIVSDLNMVCDQEIYISHANMMSMLGLMIGSLAVGPLSDRFGRKRALVVLLPAHVIVAISSVFVTSVPVFLLCRLVGTIFSCAYFNCVWLLGIETVPREKRIYANMFAMYGWSLGVLLDLFLAFFIREWRTLQLAMEAPKIVFAVACYWLFSESHVWLVSKGRYFEAQDVLNYIAKKDKVHTTATTLQVDLISDISEETGKPYLSTHVASKNGISMMSNHNGDVHKNDEIPSTIETRAHLRNKQALFQLLTSPTMMVRILVLSFNWVVSNMVYYGFTLNVGYIIEGSLYLNVLLIGMLELVSTSAVLFGLLKGSRKTVYCSCLFLSSMGSLAAITTVHLDGESTSWLRIALVNIGKLGISGAFATMFIYSSEMLPTSLRQSGVGFCGFVSRFGGLISPYVARLDTIVGGSMGRALPLALFGSAAFIAGVLAYLLLPETAGKRLPETVESAENISGQIMTKKRVHPKPDEAAFDAEAQQKI